MKKEETAFGAGCFWGVQLLFSETPGVVKAEAGYMGGEEESDEVTYEQVCSGTTGHAEVVHIVFDPSKVTYEKLLELFWKNHNPTTLNRQGPDVGTQYRSAIFYYTPEQKKTAQSSRDAHQKTLGERKIVTEIERAGRFYRAEEYHQDYLKKRGQTSCHI